MFKRVMASLMIVGLVLWFVGAIVAIFWSPVIDLYLVLGGIGSLLIGMIWGIARRSRESSQRVAKASLSESQRALLKTWDAIDDFKRRGKNMGLGRDAFFAVPGLRDVYLSPKHGLNEISRARMRAQENGRGIGNLTGTDVREAIDDFHRAVGRRNSERGNKSHAGDGVRWPGGEVQGGRLTLEQARALAVESAGD